MNASDATGRGAVVVAGSSGLIGRALVAELRRRGRPVRRLVRRPPAGDGEFGWDPATGRLDAAALEGAAAVVNLAGAGIGDQRWSPARKELLRRSRVDGAALLARTIAGMAAPPGVILSASAIGVYGERGDTELTEASEPGRGFLADLCREWEQAARLADHGSGEESVTEPDVRPAGEGFGDTSGTAQSARQSGEGAVEGAGEGQAGRSSEETSAEGSAAGRAVRIVLLRTGVVLAAEGGFLRRQLPLFKLGLGGRLGPAGRWVSWISLPDTTAAICHLLDSDSEVSGPVNLTAPEPVTNGAFTKALGRAVRRPAVLPVPTALPALLLGREAVAALTESARVVPETLLADGFRFTHTGVDATLADALRR